MTPETATDLLRNAMQTGLVIGLPVMAAGMFVGLIVSLGQAVTQLQEQTISFVPKLIAMVLVLVLAMPWMLSVLSDYTVQLFQGIPGTV